jgi:hypothetical protein
MTIEKYSTKAAKACLEITIDQDLKEGMALEF